ncbi:MAG: hypothetical protein GQ574_10255 [Crocinitomix sp.]|nr:hypothetical protein [Crocinitomix sp.]
MGTAMVIYSFSDSFRGSVIGLNIFGGLFLLLGLFVCYKLLPTLIKTLTGSHPLLKAIKNNQSDYILWMFIKQIDTTLGNGGATVGSSNNITIYSKDGDMFDLILSRKKSTEEYMDYLVNTFDIPYKGYSEETREQVNNRAGRTKWNRM